MPFNKRTLRPQSSWGRGDHSSWHVGTYQCLPSQNEGVCGYNGNKPRTKHESQETTLEQTELIHVQPGCLIPYPIMAPKAETSTQGQLSDLCRLSLSLEDELLVLHRRTSTLQHRTAATYMTICKARQRGMTPQHGSIVLGECLILVE
ncbi:hypothetical protein XELAEV_18041924mg [Xenopus laevis]|uniref:Uncharacterized protein n=1 Tax=Xenopus laevis TaxID=8355 RepID=A0A974H618_XENLA|nr:hypothetical protein XELAEV_18041924mg [Xenopus laevis]